jgi:hypothetical protein
MYGKGDEGGGLYDIVDCGWGDVYTITCTRIYVERLNHVRQTFVNSMDWASCVISVSNYHSPCEVDDHTVFDSQTICGQQTLYCQ